MARAGQGKYAYIVLPHMRNIKKLKKYWKNNLLGEVTIHLADPQQKQQEIHLSVKRKGIERQKLTFDFRHSDIYAGKSISQSIKPPKR